MSRFRTSTTRATLTTAIVMVFILPIVSLALSYIFRNDIAVDKPRIVEELIKSAVSLFISITALFVSSALSRKEIDRDIKALRCQSRLQILALGDSLRSVVINDIVLDKSLLESSSTEVIRQNFQKEELFKMRVQNLRVEVEKIRQMILSAKPEVGMGCSDYSSLISAWSVALQSYLIYPSVTSAERIKTIARELLLLTEEDSS
ncbi:hypothetical protein ANRL4_01657 [Anaerolineae bacterium]|nr:hypothetical protein ANRL4_01657 [Anaerolineae bacterium]